MESLLLAGYLTFWARFCEVATGQCSPPEALAPSIPISGVLTAPQEKSSMSLQSFKGVALQLEANLFVYWAHRADGTQSFTTRVTLRQTDGGPFFSECSSYVARESMTPFPEGACAAYLGDAYMGLQEQVGVSFSRQPFKLEGSQEASPAQKNLMH